MACEGRRLPACFDNNISNKKTLAIPENCWPRIGSPSAKSLATPLHTAITFITHNGGKLKNSDRGLTFSTGLLNVVRYI